MKSANLILLSLVLAGSVQAQTGASSDPDALIGASEGRTQGAADGAAGTDGAGPCSRAANALGRAEAALLTPVRRRYSEERRTHFMVAYQLAYLRAFAQAHVSCEARSAETRASAHQSIRNSESPGTVTAPAEAVGSVSH